MLPTEHQAKRTDIFAAQKIIADISSGLYRSPAAAIKELVTNAYDADAETVIIETDVPHFRNLVVRDDGVGMNIEHFLRVITHIGGSRKRIIGGDVTERGRKIIGRIGIGILAVAQLGYKFYISSSVSGSPTKFIAEVNLEPFHKDDAALQSMGRMRDDSDEVLIGAVQYIDNIPEDRDSHYTIITVPELKSGIISEMTSAVRAVVGAKEVISKENPITEYSDLANVVRSHKRADTSIDGYYYMLYDLGHLCPVNYIKDGPFFTSESYIENADSLTDVIPYIKDFKVIVDGIELQRPQLFPSKCAINYAGPKPKVYPLHFERSVAGQMLKFKGYIYAQQPRIDPEGFLGIHIRIRNVGIGKYDRTWLGYPFDEGIKFGQLSGEIFAEDGLEQALNIDRDSFKETDVHYQAIRAYLWNKLRTEIFPQFKVRQNEYRNQRKVASRDEYLLRFNEKLSQLPAIVTTEGIRLSQVKNPNISNWIEVKEESLTIDKDRWDKLLADSITTSKEAQDRLKRVIQVLVASELLNNVEEQEIENLIQALAIAIQ